MNEIDVTLTKAKYRPRNFRILHRSGKGLIDPPEGTRVFNAGRFTSKSSNAGTVSKIKTLVPRRRAYGPF